MFEAQILIAPSIQSTEVFSVLGPWMTREGDNAVLALEVIADTLTVNSNFTVELWTKKSEDPGDGEKATASKTYVGGTDSPDVFTFESNATDSVAMDELIRYRFVFDDNVTKDDWVLFRMLAATWFDSVNGGTTAA